MAKRCRSSSSSPRASTVGRWMMSMGETFLQLLAVELDDELLVDRDVDVLPQREVPDGHFEAFGATLEPRRQLAVERVEVVADDDERAGLGAQGDDVALAQPVAGDGDPFAVDED